MVNPIYTPADKRLPATLLALNKSNRDAHRPTGTEKNRTLLQLTEAVGELEATVTELSSQSAHTVQPAPVDLSSSAPGAFPTFERALAFPAPVGGGRVATLAFSGEFVRTSSSGNMTIWLELLQAGSPTWRRSAAFYVGDTASAPAAWGNPSIDDFIQIKVPNAAAAGMTMRFYTTTFVSSLVTAQFRNILVTLTYGTRI